MKTQRQQFASDAGWEASVSAWVDGEPDAPFETLDTPQGRQLWDTYHLIGDVMRSQDLAIRPSADFNARLSAALEAEPAIVAPAPLPRRHHLLRLSLSGVAVAAAVASVVWMARPALFGADVAAPATPVLAQADPTPPEGADPELADYMAAHQAMAGAGPVRQVSFDGMGSR